MTIKVKIEDILAVLREIKGEGHIFVNMKIEDKPDGSSVISIHPIKETKELPPAEDSFNVDNI